MDGVRTHKLNGDTNVGTDCIGGCNSNYHMIMTTTALTMNGTGIITKYILPTKFVGSQ